MPASPPLARPLSRRTLLALAPAAAVTGALAGCETVAGGAAGSPGDVGQDYGVTVTTPDDGEVTIDRFPRRIAALNGSRVIPFLLPFLSADHELVGYGGDATPEDFPWIADQLEELPQSVDADGPNVEAYASWEPDLLLANGNLGDYWEPARALAPLVQLPETDWRATTRLLGEVFQDPEAAEATVAQVEATIAAQRLTTPVTAAVVTKYQEDGTVSFRVPGAELPNLLAELGVQVAESATALDGYEDVSLEQLGDRLAVDWVIVVNSGDELQQSLLSDPLFTAAEPVAAGRVVVLDALQSAAGFPVTPPTVPVVLESLAPLLGSVSPPP